MWQLHKPAHLRKGSVSLEATFFIIIFGIILFGIVNVIVEMRDYFRLNTLTTHVGQAIARSDTVSADSIQAILDAAKSDTLLSDLSGLCVVVANQEKTLFTVPGACACSSQNTAPSSVMSSLSSATSSMFAVVVNGCTSKLQSTSVFTSTAKID